MPRQLELLKRSGLEIEPEANRSEPRLWIRRLVIWSEPGVVLREIRLRPGLNIIWAPDPSDRPGGSEEQVAPGHGSGKTLFCRLPPILPWRGSIRARRTAREDRRCRFPAGWSVLRSWSMVRSGPWCAR